MLVGALSMSNCCRNVELLRKQCTSEKMLLILRNYYIIHHIPGNLSYSHYFTTHLFPLPHFPLLFSIYGTRARLGHSRLLRIQL